MKGLWLHRAPRSAAAPLIVFCNGWGMTEQVVAHLDGAGCNVLCLYDYRSPELPDSLRDEVRVLVRDTADSILIAWSLGVFMSAYVRRQLPPFDVTLACNGTQRPIDATCGIPPAIYEATERALSPATRDAFMANAGMDSGLCRQHVEELREELTAVRQLASSGTVDAPPFDAALISRKDRIFSARNQRRWWQSRPETRIIPQEGGHCPFADFSAWLELAHV